MLEEGPVGRQDSHNGPAYGGVSDPGQQPGAGAAPSGRAPVPPRAPSTYGVARVAPYATGPAVTPPHRELCTARRPAATRRWPRPPPPPVTHPRSSTEPAGHRHRRQRHRRARRRRRTVLISTLSAVVLLVWPLPPCWWYGPVRSTAGSPGLRHPPRAPSPRRRSRCRPRCSSRPRGGRTHRPPPAYAPRSRPLVRTAVLGSRVNISVVDVALGEIALRRESGRA